MNFNKHLFCLAMLLVVSNIFTMDNKDGKSWVDMEHEWFAQRQVYRAEQARREMLEKQNKEAEKHNSSRAEASKKKEEEKK